MFPARQFAAAVTALLLIAGAFFVFLFSAADAQAEGPSGTCEDAAELAVLSSPIAPWKGAPLRVVFAAEKPLEGELSLIAPDGSVAAKSRRAARRAAVFLVRRGRVAGRGDVAREARARRRAGRVRHDHARNRRARRRAAAAARDARGASGRCAIRGTARRKTCIPHGSRSCSTRRSTRSRRGRRCMRCCAIDRAISCSTIWVSREDEMGLIIRPDCADLPYFLRAYFAFKMGLPFGYSKCSRGGGGQPPKCYAVVEHSESRGACAAAPPDQNARSRWRAPGDRQSRARRPSSFRSPSAAKRLGLVPSFGHYLRRPSPTASIPEPGGRRRATTTPIIIPCR